MNDELDLYDVYRALRDDWLLIAAITALSAVIAVFLALGATEIYRAEIVVVQVDDAGGGGAAAMAQQLGGLASLAGINLGAIGSGRDQIALPYLQSRALVEEFVSRNDLIDTLFPEPSADEPPTLWLATKTFMDDIRRIEMDPGARLVTVSVEWTDPELAAQWANGLVALANEKLRARAQAEAERNIAYLNDRIRDTDVVGIQQAMYNLIEGEMKTVMLANASEDFAFAVVDPAVTPEKRIRPKRTLMVVVGTVFGGFIALIVVGLRRLYLSFRARERAA